MAFSGKNNGFGARNLYQDEDGIATTQSQATYAARVQILLLVTCLLSLLGFSAALSSGYYTAKNLEILTSLNILDLLRYSICHLLWVSGNIA